MAPASAPGADDANPQQWVILIGVEKYEKANPLQLTVNDVRQLTNTLDSGRIAATDTHQLLIESSFAFPGTCDVLIPRTTLFNSRELPNDLPVEVGFMVNHGVFRVGPWTFWLTLEKQDRYPGVENIIPAADSAKTRLSLSAEDVLFLLEVIPRLPTETDLHGRITLDLNDKVVMLAKEDGPSPVTQVVLRNSHRRGDEMRFNTDRQFLVRAVQLGFHEIELHGAESPGRLPR